jgi:hypothetical protein
MMAVGFGPGKRAHGGVVRMIAGAAARACGDMILRQRRWVYRVYSFL